MSEPEQPNVANNLLWIHHVISRALSVSVDRSAVYAEHGFPDAATKAGFLAYEQSLSSTLSGHHLAEDEQAFPYFRPLLPDAPYDDLTSDHHAMEPLITRLNAAIAGAASEDDAEARRALGELHEAVVGLEQIWYPHIQKEEQSLSADALAQVMTPEEHGALARSLSEFSQQHTGPAPLTVPFVLYNLETTERAAMAGVMPPMITQELVPGPWKAQWEVMKPFLLE